MFENEIKNHQKQWFSHLIISLKLTFIVSIYSFSHFLTLDKDNFADLALSNTQC